MARKKTVDNYGAHMHNAASDGCFVIAIKPDMEDSTKFQAFSYHTFAKEEDIGKMMGGNGEYGHVVPHLIRGTMMALLSQKFNQALYDLDNSSNHHDINTAIAIAESDNVIPANIFGDKFTKKQSTVELPKGVD